MAVHSEFHRNRPLIQCLHLSKRYDGGGIVLDDATIDINRSDFVFLFGPSGAGKSSFFKLLLSLEPPTGGNILFEGCNVQRMPPKELPYLRRRLGLVLQEITLIEDRNVFENVALPLEAAGKDRLLIRRKVKQVLRFVGLELKMASSCKGLSTTERQRAAIGRAIVNDPLILLADEPSGRLDEEGERGIMDLLGRIHSRGTAVLVATNDRTLPGVFPDARVIALEKGRLVEGAFGFRAATQA